MGLLTVILPSSVPRVRQGGSVLGFEELWVFNNVEENRIGENIATMW